MLNLDDNQIKCLPVHALHSLTSLMTLSIQSNMLLFLPDGVFDTLININRIYLNNNQIASLPVGLFRRTTKLQYLYLSNNLLRSLFAGEFDTLVDLEHLSLSHNKLLSLPNAIFDNLPKKTHIDLRNNYLGRKSCAYLSLLAQTRKGTIEYHPQNSLSDPLETSSFVEVTTMRDFRAWQQALGERSKPLNRPNSLLAFIKCGIVIALIPVVICLAFNGTIITKVRSALGF